MTTNKPYLPRVGFGLFIFAIILGMVLILVRALPDLEATMYSFIRYNYPVLRSLRCPILMTQDDRQSVSVRLQNPLDRPLNFYLVSQFSAYPIMETNEQRLELLPGETRKVSWEVDRDNIDLGSFILARVFYTSASSLPMREATCGTLVLPLPIQGGPAIYYASFIVMLVCGVSGFLIWHRTRDPGNPSTPSQSRWMVFITAIIAFGIIASLLNWWFFALVAVGLAILALAAFLLLRIG